MRPRLSALQRYKLYAEGRKGKHCKCYQLLLTHCSAAAAVQPSLAMCCDMSKQGLLWLCTQTSCHAGVTHAQPASDSI